jgi:hypothetical protein
VSVYHYRAMLAESRRTLAVVALFNLGLFRGWDLPTPS